MKELIVFMMLGIGIFWIAPKLVEYINMYI